MRYILMILFFVSVTANADVLNLKNGDRITGEIKLIWDDKVSIEPAYSDEFDVDLEDIESIDSDGEFDVELYDGRQENYRFMGIDDAGNALLDANGREAVVAYTDIKRVEEIEEYFEWESRVDLSSSLSRGNTNSLANSLNGSYQFKLGDRRTLFELNMIRETLDEETVRNSDRFNISYDWIFKDPWFLAINATYDRDEIARVDDRYSINPALGYDIWDDPGRTLNVQLGAGYQSETVNTVTTTGAVLDWRLRYTHDFFSGDLEFYHNHQLTKNQPDEGERKKSNVILNSTTGFRYEITDDIYLNIELKYDYETQPALLVESENLTFLVGAGIEFD